MKKSDLFTKIVPYLLQYRMNRWFGIQNFNPRSEERRVGKECL